MRAVICTKYGPPEVLQLREVEKPTPRRDEVLIKIHAATVTPSDVVLRSGKFPFLWWLPIRIMYGVIRPRKLIPGYELAGEIEAVGKDVRRFKAGDQVFGATMWKLSCSAEYVCVPEKAALALKPANMTYKEAVAVVDGANTALHFLRKGGIQSGQEILIIGASGSIGTCAVQLARYFGAEVTGVCSTSNVEMVKSLGANHVIDYTQEDFTQNGATYDIIFDTVGKSSFSRCKGSLKKNGRYLDTIGGITHRVLMLWTSITGGKKVVYTMSTTKAETLMFLKELVEAGKIKSVIDRCYPLEQIVEAHRYVETGHKKGNVIITI